MTRRIAAALLALAAACGGNTGKPGMRLGRPSGIAVFHGVLSPAGPIQAPGPLSPWIAVANGAANELRIVAAADDSTVSAPGRFFPLAVPTGSRPERLAVAILPIPSQLPPGGLPRPPTAAPDALVVVPAGTAELELIDTWSGIPAVVATTDLSAAVGSTVEVFAIVGAPALEPAAGGGWQAAQDRAVFWAALTGGRLARVEVVRRNAGQPGSPVDFGAVDVRSTGGSGNPGFDAVGFGFSPDSTKLYVATQDTIVDALGASGVGVAEIDVTAADWTTTVRLIPVGGPTVAVAAMDVMERNPVAGQANTYPVPPVAFGAYSLDKHLAVGLGPTRRRNLYAALDPASCGVGKPIACGIVVFDLDGGALHEDPAGEQAHLSPLNIPGVALAILPTRPPATGNEQTLTPTDAPALQIQMISPGTGQTWTESLAAVPSTDGRVYIVDLSRLFTPSDRSYLRGDTRTQIVGLQQARAADPEKAATFYGWYIGIEPQPNQLLVNSSSPQPLANQTVLEGSLWGPAIDPPSWPGRIRVTPGYTPDETWTAAWQGALPGLQQRRGVLGRLGSGEVYVAVQTRIVAGQQPNDVANLFDPALGVHAGDPALADGDAGAADYVEIYPDTFADCPLSPPATGNIPLTYVEARVAGFLPPVGCPASGTCPGTGVFPGGAVRLAADPCAPGNPLQPGDERAVTVTIASSGMVLSGQALGYAGRPPIDLALSLPPWPPPSTGGKPGNGGVPDTQQPHGPRIPYVLQWSSETAAAASCPLDPWPTDPSSPVFAGCLEGTACRTACETLALARKTRRLFYLGDLCPDHLAFPFGQCSGSNTGECDTCEIYWPLAPPDERADQAQWAGAPVYSYDWEGRPQPTGPALEFALAAVKSGADKGEDRIIRGSFIQFQSKSGMLQTSRRPLVSGTATGGVLPTGIVVFDRSRVPGRENDGVRFLVSYVDNLVLDFSAGKGIGDVGVIQ